MVFHKHFCMKHNTIFKISKQFSYFTLNGGINTLIDF